MPKHGRINLHHSKTTLHHPGNSKKVKSKIHKVMDEYKHGSLHSGPGGKHKVHSREQAIAIALSVASKLKK